MSPRKGAGTPTRITASFTVDLVHLLDDWGKRNNMKTRSEALRAIVAWAFAQPNVRDRAFSAAYQQALAELRQLGHEILSSTVDALRKRIGR